MWDGSLWWGVAEHKGISHMRGVPSERGVAAPKMADDKVPAKAKVTKMMKIRINKDKGGLPQGIKVIQGR